MEPGQQELFDLANSSIRRVANTLKISEDYATVLLVSFNWDEQLVSQNFSFLLAAAIRNAGIVFTCHYDTKESFCESCKLLLVCRNYGCDHFFCYDCCKGYVEPRVADGELNIKCPVETCDKMMAPSRFLNDISEASQSIFGRGLLLSYASSKAQKNTVLEKVFTYTSAAANYFWTHKCGLFSLIMVVIAIYKLFRTNPIVASLVLYSLFICWCIFVAIRRCICAVNRIARGRNR